MEEAHSLVGIPVLHTETGTCDAGSIGNDRNRNAGQSKQNPPRYGFFNEIAVKHGKGEEAHQGTDSAASFGNFKLHGGKFDHVSFVQDWHSEYGKNGACEFRCK